MTTEEAVKEETEETTPGPFDDAEFAFAIRRNTSGEYVISTLDQLGATAPPNLEDIKAACLMVAQNIQAQETASLVAQQMAQVATMMAQTQQQGKSKTKRTPNGLHLPR